MKCIISYDGTNFFGFQIQPGKRTIHGEIEKALKIVHKGQRINIQASGRTDKGVHAKEQTIQFESNLQIPIINWKKALNALLPKDINVLDVSEVPRDFHVRYHVLEKEYRYYISTEKEFDVFNRNYIYQFPYLLNIEKMIEACSYLEGEHDFTTFSSSKATIKGSKVRNLSNVSCNQRDDKIELIFRGSGFLYNMVRIMVSCLIDVGQGTRDPIDIPELLLKKDRMLLGETVPPEGLYLWKVTYLDGSY